jgi:hypothetical protein
MGIMYASPQSLAEGRIPTYIITALYLGPVGIWLYWRYGRAKRSPRAMHHDQHVNQKEHQRHMQMDEQGMNNMDTERKLMNSDMGDSSHPHQHQDAPMHHVNHEHQHSMGETIQHEEKLPIATEPHMHHSVIKSTPFYVSVLIGVTHCGAGCVLGDIVGEWLVYGTNVSISSRTLYPEFLIDYGFALFFGIAFQYFSIAPMSGDWGIRSVIRAAKADVLSLTAFEIGLFGWMAIYQVAIWDWKLGTVTTVYWWMMQVGMCLGFVTSFPMNWYLVKWGIKEPHVM